MLIVAVARGVRKVRMALLLAVGLALSYLLFASTARWGVYYTVRYQIPQFVAWSPAIAIALATLPKMVTRVALCFLVITCVPQLFNNIEEPFFHHNYSAKSLAPYFLDTNVQKYVLVSSAQYRSNLCGYLGDFVPSRGVGELAPAGVSALGWTADSRLARQDPERECRERDSSL